MKTAKEILAEDTFGVRILDVEKMDTINDFYVLFSVGVSSAVAIVAAAVGSRFLMGEAASVGTYLATTANVITALAVAILWSISFVGIIIYLKSHSGNIPFWE